MISVRLLITTVLTAFTVIVAGCSEEAPPEAAAPADPAPAAAAPATTPPPAAGTAVNPLRNAYFGDLHVHTRYSFDAFIFGTVATPDDAYRFAQGQPLSHPAGYEMKLKEPLDFYAVTDHAAFLGMLPAMADPATEVSQLDVAQAFIGMETIEERRAAFQGIRPFLAGGRHDEILDMDVVRSAWSDIVAAAQRHNDPGRFTTFVAYEYTSGPDSQNLHRNVVFRDGQVPEVPYSRLESTNPEDLWRWMDDQRAAGFEALAIPHNANGSNGQMFKLSYYDDKPLDADYAALRTRNEPLVEITQVKGTSDTHPLLSPNDEWADFEIMPFRIATQRLSNVSGSYVREALLNGLVLQQSKGFNPFDFGIAGASDTHNASYAGDESEYYSKVGLLDGEASSRGAVPIDPSANPGPYDVYPCPETVPKQTSGEATTPAPRIWCGEDSDSFAQTYYTYWSAAGLTGVWAEENSRASIYDAFRRKETFATSGPRIRVRFFAGYDLNPAAQGDAAVRDAYDHGVPMGGELAGRGEGVPRFLVSAARDAHGAALQRIQVIKGWLEQGEPRERVYDVACSDGGTVDPSTHRCPDNGARVDLADCSISTDVGAAQLTTGWQDPDFDPAERAFYYVRVLENPTCRWSTWDAIRSGTEPRPDLHATIQERAWSSPIRYVPSP